MTKLLPKTFFHQVLLYSGIWLIIEFVSSHLVPTKIAPAGAESTWEKYVVFYFISPHQISTDDYQHLKGLIIINLEQSKVSLLFNRTHTHTHTYIYIYIYVCIYIYIYICVCVCVCVCVWSDSNWSFKHVSLHTKDNFYLHNISNGGARSVVVIVKELDTATRVQTRDWLRFT